MSRILWIAALIVAAMALVPGAVKAREAPWCAVMPMGWGNTVWDCSYWSLKACVPLVIAGNRGFCNPNPAYNGPSVKERRIHRRHHVKRS